MRYPKLATMVLFFAFALNRGGGKGPIFTAVRPAVNVSDGGQADGDGRTASLARRGVTFALVRAVERSTGNPHSCIRRRYGRSRGRGRTEGRDGRDVGGSEERAPSVAANDIIELRARFPLRSLSPFEIPRRVCLPNRCPPRTSRVDVVCITAIASVGPSTVHPPVLGPDGPDRAK